jgi:hypothetical protein
VRNILRTKPASNCKFSGDHYCRECVRIPQAPPSALLPINLHVGGNRESGTFAIGLSFQAVATGNNLNLPVRQRAKWHCHAVCVSARGPNHHRRGSPIIARNEINGLEGSSRRRWGSFFDQPSHLRIGNSSPNKAKARKLIAAIENLNAEIEEVEGIVNSRARSGPARKKPPAKEKPAGKKKAATKKKVATKI